MMDNGGKQTWKEKSKRLQIIRYSIAGVTIVLLIALFIIALSFYRLSPNRLFNEKFEPYLLTSSNKNDSPRSTIEEAFWRKDYKEVVRLGKTSALTVRDIFLSGMAYLETDNLSKAISSFQVVITEENKKRAGLRDTAEYYLALTWLKNQDYDQAIELMVSIYNNPLHQYKDKFSSSYISKIKRLKWR